MRNYLLIFSLLISIFSFGQSKENPFAGDNADNGSVNRYANPQAANNGNGNGGSGTTGNGEGNQGQGLGNGGPASDGLPIDDYIPLFIIVALGIIVYQKRLVKSTKA